MIPFLRSAATWTAHHALPAVAATVIVAAAAGGGITYAVASHSTPATSAAAATPSPAAGTSTGAPRAARAGALRADAQKLLKLVTTDTGQSLPAIEAQLKAGKTLDQIAGSNATKLEDDVIAALKTAMDRAVTSGRITAAQEITRLAKARTILDKVMAEPGTTLLQQVARLRQAAGNHARGAAPSSAPSAAATPAI